MILVPRRCSPFSWEIRGWLSKFVKSLVVARHGLTGRHLRIITINFFPPCSDFLSMKILRKQIIKELQTAKHCAIYEDELNRVWPRPTPGRERKIRKFAEENGWRLRFYSEGLCAIFDKPPRRGKLGTPKIL